MNTVYDLAQNLLALCKVIINRCLDTVFSTLKIDRNETSRRSLFG